MATRLPLPIPGGPPLVFSSTPEASCPPSLCPTPEDLLAGFSRHPVTLALSPLPNPWRPPSPAAAVSLEVVSAVAPPPAVAPPGSSSAPLLSNSPAVAVSRLPATPAPPTFSASYFDANSSVSSPLHLAISSALSSMTLPPAWYSPPAQLSFLHAGGSSAVRLLLLAAIAIAFATAALGFSPTDPSMSRIIHLLSLGLPPSPLPPPPPSLRILRPPAPPLTPHSPTPADNIACRNEHVDDQTSGGETRWSTVGGSVPRRKSSSSPLAVVGDGINRPLF